MVSFPFSYNEILNRIDTIDPVAYGSSRNFVDGAVSHLSPYISRGVISTKLVMSKILEQGHSFYKVEKFIQELAWRDYWQQVWIAKGAEINSDLKNVQSPIANWSIPKDILDATTGIAAIDSSIQQLYETGYMHNHLRMYVASIACNVAQSHWKIPAQWLYYHLLDGDWASNALSWQWVAGANSNKKYYANQENINKYCRTQQKNTFLDVSYETFNTGMEIPETLKGTASVQLKTELPEPVSISVNESLPTLIYNFYNLDPVWKKNIPANRILLLEPSHFEQYPVSKNSIDFVLGLSENIENIQVYVGEFQSLIASHNLKDIYFKEHPLNGHYKGIEEPRDWMFDVKGYYSSFFGFWKKCKKQLKY
ncbi:deoxyribodipyrimidine photolyase [Flagellimonas sp. HMM57]|uniref:FAD-binding domain-containing protein n=1 Tax=unclassified Flagellimonas TaxID=2644544 RepID=UPI0013D08E74|nr:MULTISPECIES: FAD-binding domain-containing protein [unclassified Flagellimonas]UII75656.1 deoxyribodipyrimidine photolyase [Flagellimonas sp. HMM57]